VSREEIRLTLLLPPDLSGPRRLGVAYQVNDGTAERPQWRDVVSAEETIAFAAGRVAEVRLTQNRGTMEYSRKRMQHVESFTAALEEQPPSP
jgi:hypothetical protein